MASHTICGLQHFLNVARVFPGLWRLHSAWDKAEIPQRALPLPTNIVLGIADWLLEKGEVAAAALVMTGFNCFLRTGELLSLRKAHVRYAASRLHGVLLLPWTKSGGRSGAPEIVVFDDPLGSCLLDLACVASSIVFFPRLDPAFVVSI